MCLDRREHHKVSKDKKQCIIFFRVHNGRRLRVATTVCCEKCGVHLCVRTKILPSGNMSEMSWDRYHYVWVHIKEGEGLGLENRTSEGEDSSGVASESGSTGSHYFTRQRSLGQHGGGDRNNGSVMTAVREEFQRVTRSRRREERGNDGKRY